MKRVALIAVVLIAAASIALALSGSGDTKSYQVRAIFSNAGFAINGEDVRVAGVNVGVISSVDLTAQNTAAIVLDITDDGFKDFRQDATCTIRPQSLIGDRYVECTPTLARPVGVAPPPESPVIKSGPGKGQHLVPVTQTSTPVDLDLIDNIWRLPYRERLSILLDEFGTAVAGQGTNLREAIRRSNPALAQTDEVLKILASQNKILAELATNSDTVLAPLARDRERVVGFIVNANNVNQAVAERGAAFERNLELLPSFLTQLTPTMERIGGLAGAATPVFENLLPVAPAISKTIENLTPLNQAAIPALITLGDSAAPLQADLEAFSPRITDLSKLTTAGLPATTDLANLLASFKKNGGVDRLMQFLLYTTTTTNGYDQYSHYLRAALLVNLCSDYATSTRGGCSANFQDSSAAANQPLSPTQQLIAGASSQSVFTGPFAKTTVGANSNNDPTKLGAPKTTLPNQLQSGASKPTAKTAKPAPSATTKQDPRSGLFDYLLGPQS
ncbi:MAG: MlaD family protein [Solirubrobacterales bacterium]|nr:MlaD family protein [Solirubrobacterales bacterium]